MFGWLKGRKAGPAPTLEAGLEHHRAGRLAEAAAVYHALLAHDPEHIDALHFAGVAAYQQGDLAQAAELISAALERNPANAPAQNNLGNVFAAQERIAEAGERYRKAVDLAPNYVDAWVNLAISLKAQGRLDDAASAYRSALSHDPRHAVALCNLAAIHNDQNRPGEALACCDAALAVRPDFPEALANRGAALIAFGRRAEAEACYERALAIDPRFTAAILGRAAEVLMRGDYATGLPLLETRFERSVSTAVQLGLRDLSSELDPARRWSGGKAAGKRILIWTDQGLGDSVMTMRYLPMLKSRGFSRVTVYGEKPLERAFLSLPGVDAFVDKREPVPFGEFDLHCPIYSLMLAFGTRIDRVPPPVFPLPDALKSKWRARLEAIPGRRVGLAWTGSTLNPTHALRSLKLDAFASIFAVPGLAFFSLQKGVPSAGFPLTDWMHECHDLLDTAALIAGLDLVISVDTVISHLTGSVGTPVWLLNRFESEWRWGMERADSPWYPSMRIFRQSASGRWDDLLERLALALNSGTEP